MNDTQAAHRAAFFWLIGAAVVLIAYAWINDPLRFALMRLVPLAFAALFVAACTGYGLIARASDWLTSSAIGIGIVGAISFVAALGHIAYRATFAIVIVAGLVMLAVKSRRTPKAERRTDVLALAIIAIILVSIIPYVAAPDVSTDGLEYTC